jgi:hypothetical protein
MEAVLVNNLHYVLNWASTQMKTSFVISSYTGNFCIK